MLTGTERPEYSHDPLPEWVRQLRAPQVDAVNEAVEHFLNGAQFVFLDGPVGAGKTLIAELVRRELWLAGLPINRSLYVCSDRALQDQFTRDFPEGRVLKGRSNYLTMKGSPAITADDCQAFSPQDRCQWCDPKALCPYRVAKIAAENAELAVTNTAMLLTATNFADFLRERDFVTVDECDLLESSLMGFVEFEVPLWVNREIGLAMPGKGVHKTTIIRWLGEFSEALAVYLAQRGDGEAIPPKRRRAIASLIMDAKQVTLALERDITQHGDEGDEEGEQARARGLWVRDYDTQTFKMRPVMVDRYGTRFLWRHARRWLLMSGTIVSAEELVESLGIVGEWATVSVPSTFPLENRPVVLAPIADMTYRAGDRDWPMLAYAIEQICARHEGRVLIHTVSYKLTEWLSRELGERGLESPDGSARRVFHHTDARGKEHALSAYLRTEGAVLLSPSASRGLDLADDKCRVQILCKTPFPSLGNRQVSARLHQPGGDLWYSVQTVRDLVQMTGRGVRSETDTCVTYVLDRQFTTNVWQKRKHLFLPSFVEAVQANTDIRWLMTRRTA